MSEELEQNNDGTWSGLKKTIIGVATTAVMGLGTWGVTQLTGGDKEEAPVQQAAPGSPGRGRAAPASHRPPRWRRRPARYRSGPRSGISGATGVVSAGSGPPPAST